jgi:branched-chain amino acid transport system permease protein
VVADVLANAEHIVFGVLILYFLIKEPQGLARLWERFAQYVDSKMLARQRVVGFD